MSNLGQLKNKIKDILLDIPVDIVDEDTGDIYEVPEWESFSPRKYKDEDTEEFVLTRKIGSYNVIDALDYLYKQCETVIRKSGSINKSKIINATHEIFHEFLEDLEKDKAIRKIPEVKRKEMRIVVDNTINEHIDLIVDQLHVQSNSRNTVNGLVDELNSAYGIPKPVIRKVARGVFDRNQDEIEELNNVVVDLIRKCVES